MKGTKDFEDDQNGQLFTRSPGAARPGENGPVRVAVHIGTDVFIIQGAADVITPVAGARNYFAKIEAPHKEFIALPNAGHFAFMTSDAFLPALTDKVRPAAIANGA